MWYGVVRKFYHYFYDMTRKTPKHYLTRYIIFIVCNLIDNSSQPMSEQEFLQLLGKKKGNESV